MLPCACYRLLDECNMHPISHRDENMHIDMQHLHQVFFSVAITHLLSNDLGLEKPKVLKRHKFPDVILTDRQTETNYYNPLAHAR